MGHNRKATSLDGIIKAIEDLHHEGSIEETSLKSGDDGVGGTTHVVRSLVPDIISDILSRLPIENIMRYKVVSKKWDALTKDPHFIAMHLKRALCLPPRIILEPKVADSVNSLYLIDREGGKWSGREIPVKNLQGDYMSTVSSCHGFLCVSASKSNVDALFVYNPVTRESVALPRSILGPGKSCPSIGFGFDPTSKKYKVVRVIQACQVHNSESSTKCEIITLGEGSWRELEISHQIECCSHKQPVLWDDALHWIIQRKCHPGSEGILALDLVNENFRTIKFPPSLIRTIRFPLFLFNFGGSLSLVEHLLKKFSVWRIVRINNKTGYKFFRSSYSITVRYHCVMLNLLLKDKLPDSSFLFDVMKIDIRNPKDVKDHLALYSPEQDVFRFVDISGIPEVYKTNLFVPCLVSLGAAYGNSEVNLN